MSDFDPGLVVGTKISASVVYITRVPSRPLVATSEELLAETTRRAGRAHAELGAEGQGVSVLPDYGIGHPQETLSPCYRTRDDRTSTRSTTDVIFLRTSTSPSWSCPRSDRTNSSADDARRSSSPLSNVPQVRSTKLAQQLDAAF